MTDGFRHLRRVNQQEEPFPVRHFFWQVIDTEIEAVINELVVEMGNEAILETKANELFDMLLGDVISSELMVRPKSDIPCQFHPINSTD